MTLFGQFTTQLAHLSEEIPLWGKVAIGGTAATVVVFTCRRYFKKPRKTSIKEDFEKGKVYLYQFPYTKCIPSLSPYCLKLETWLRMAEIPYEIPSECNAFIRSSEGTLPFLEYNGKEYPDSALAIRDMTKLHQKDMDAHLTAEERATGRAFEALAENSLCIALLQNRYAEHLDETFEQLKTNKYGCLFRLMLWLFKQRIRKVSAERMKLTAIGKHSRSEVLNIATEDLRAISNFLGTKNYFFGSHPTQVDATLFGVLSQIVYAPYDYEMKTFVQEDLSNIQHYCDRIKERFWPDWKELTLEQ